MAVVTLLSLLSMLIPPAAFLLSGVPVGLVTLRKGSHHALQVIGGSLLLMSLMSLALKLQPVLGLVLLLSVWLPVWLCALTLRYTEKPAFMSLTAATIAALFIGFMYARFGDVEAWWRTFLQEMLGAGLSSGTAAHYQQAMEIAPPLMNAVVAASMVVSLTLSVLIARWWQSRLFNPGGFATEFQAFCLPRYLVLPTIIGMTLLFLEEQAFQPPLRDLLVVLVVLYLFQGIAAVHRTVKSRQLSRNWLFGMYCLLALLPQIMVVFIAWIGMTDSLLMSRRGSGGGEK